MKRVGILIEVSRTSGSWKRLYGASRDVERMGRWLRRKEGGAWKRQEIVALHDPDPGVLYSAIRAAAGADYALVSFSGHGVTAEHKNGLSPTQQVILGDGSGVELDDLIPDVKRCTVICDACRQFSPPILPVIRKALPPRRVERSWLDYRAKFNRAVQAAGEGRCILYGCELGGKSYEDEEDGGCFTQSLVEGAWEWCVSNHQAGVFTVVNALSAARSLVSKRTADEAMPQRPHLRQSNMDHGNEFPFAVTFGHEPR